MSLDPRLDRLPAGYLCLSEQYLIQEINQTLLQVLGYQAQELSGKSLNQLVSLAGRIFVQTHVVPKLRYAGSVREVYLPLRNAAGQDIPMLLNASRRGESFDFLLVPIQERSDYEDRLREARRTAELALQSRDEFLALVSHELRGPLAVLSGYLELLSAGGLEPDEAAEALSAMRKSADLQSRLVEDLLDQASSQIGKLSVRREPVDLHEILCGVVESVRPVASNKGIRVEAETSAAGRLTGDATRLHQVFWNLLSNAVKFTPAGGCIRVRARAGRVDVVDDGQGMTADFVPLVFEPFRQEKSGAGSGVGLGMSICKNLVELHGGSLQAESPGPGQGSTFSVFLPTE